ncbi:MAG: transposase [Prevotellaceae bacterium]|nr:transposase [Prevotellaceae bacterium]
MIFGEIFKCLIFCRGSNRHPRGLGLLMRFALSNGVAPLFIPPAKPWRNGIVEKFNDNVLTHFYRSETFASFEEMCWKAKEFSCFYNENHRYSSQGYKTPKQMISTVLQKTKLERVFDLTQKIFLEEGRLIFICFIRSDLKLSILNTVFTLKPSLKYSYVVCEIILEKYVLVVSLNNRIYHIFEFPMSLP